jgi:hypothetical protein
LSVDRQRAIEKRTSRGLLSRAAIAGERRAVGEAAELEIKVRAGPYDFRRPRLRLAEPSSLILLHFS